MVIAYFASCGSIIPYDNVSHVVSDEFKSAYLELYMIDQQRPVVIHGDDIKAFTEGYRDWLIMRQAALGIEVDDQPEKALEPTPMPSKGKEIEWPV